MENRNEEKMMELDPDQMDKVSGGLNPCSDLGEGPLVCEWCRETFDTFHDLKVHINEKHKTRVI